MAQDEASDNDGRSAAIVLPARLDIGSSGHLRDAVIARDGDIALDARATILVTSPGFQVLMAARDRQSAAGHALHLSDVTREFAACAATLGVPLDRLRCSGASG